MDTRLLRKLRRDAHKLYGITTFTDAEGKETYIIGPRSYGRFLSSALTFRPTLPEAVERLKAIRREYIAEYVGERKHKHKITKL